MQSPDASSAAADTTAKRLRFGDFVLDTRRAELTRAGVLVPLRPKTYALLTHLVAHAGRAVGKEELLAAVWPGVVVSDDSLSQCVAELRTALDDREAQTLIRTLPRVGYRFEAEVSPSPQDRGGEERVAAQPAVPAALGPAPAAPADSGVPHIPAGAPRASWSLRRAALWGGAVAAALAVIALAPLLQGSKGRDVPGAPRIGSELAARRSIAVMPLQDESGAPHFAEGISDEVRNELARMPDTLVIAGGTTAALAARGENDVKRIGRELGVRYVLTGRVAKSGEQVRIQVALADSQSAALLWSQHFEYANAAEWNWRRDISQRVAGAVNIKVIESTLAAAREGARSGLAIDQWMRGEYLLRRFKTRPELLEARRHFEAALAAEPDSVNALTGIAQTHRAEVMRRWIVGADRLPALAVAERFARRALAIEPNHVDALTTLGHTLAMEGDFSAARQALDKAVALNPSSAQAQRELAATHYLSGRFDAVRAPVEEALRLDPLDAGHVYQCHMLLGTALFLMQRDNEAREAFRLAQLTDPARSNPHFSLAALEALNGRHEEVKRHMAEIARLAPRASIERSRAGQFSTEPAFVAAIERYYEGLRLAGLPEKTPAGSKYAMPSTGTGAQ